MDKYIKIFELFDKSNIVYKNASVDNVPGKKQPYTQTINNYFTFEEAKDKISSIWNFSSIEINKRIDNEISPSIVKKFGDRVKDKLGISKEKDLKIKDLSKLGITETKISNKEFNYYFLFRGYKYLIAKISFDISKVHNRKWKLIFLKQWCFDGCHSAVHKQFVGSTQQRFER